MLYEAKKLMEEATELKELCMKQLGKGVFNSMSEEEYGLYKRMFDMVDTSMALVLEQAILFEAMDKKLDKLLGRGES